MLSSIAGDKVLDWHWKKRDLDTLFYIGKTRVGQLFVSKGGWTAIYRFPVPAPFPTPVRGFKTRAKASEFLEQLERAFGTLFKE